MTTSRGTAPRGIGTGAQLAGALTSDRLAAVLGASEPMTGHDGELSDWLNLLARGA